MGKLSIPISQAGVSNTYVAVTVSFTRHVIVQNIAINNEDALLTIPALGLQDIPAYLLRRLPLAYFVATGGNLNFVVRITSGATETVIGTITGYGGASGTSGPPGPSVIMNEVILPNSGTAAIIDWSRGAAQLLPLTGNAALVFNPPDQQRHLQLRTIQDVTGGHTPTFPSSVKWAGGLEPVWITTPLAVNIANYYYDGINYWAMGGVGFA